MGPLQVDGMRREPEEGGFIHRGTCHLGFCDRLLRLMTFLTVAVAVVRFRGAEARDPKGGPNGTKFTEGLQ